MKMYLETDVKRPGEECFLLPGDKNGGQAWATAWTFGGGGGACGKGGLPMTNCDYYTLTPGGLGVQSRDAVGRMFLAASNLAGEGQRVCECECECECVWGEGQDEEITAVLKQILSVASGCEETRAPTWTCVGCSVRRGKGGCFVGVVGVDAVTEGRSPGPLLSTRRASCLGRGQRRGLRVDSEIVQCWHMSCQPGQRGAHKVD